MGSESRHAREYKREVMKEREAKVASLTPREKDVFNELMKGYSMREVAEILEISYPTVNSHITHLYKKLGVKSRPNLMVKYGEVWRKTNQGV